MDGLQTDSCETEIEIPSPVFIIYQFTEVALIFINLK